MPRSLALAWRVLLVLSLAVNPLVGLRTALAADGNPTGAMPCQHMAAGEMAAMTAMAGMAATKSASSHVAGATSGCPCGSGCGVPRCDSAACCGPFVVVLPIAAGVLAQALPTARPDGSDRAAAPAPDIDSLIRPPIA